MHGGYGGRPAVHIDGKGSVTFVKNGWTAGLHRFTKCDAGRGLEMTLILYSTLILPALPSARRPGKFERDRKQVGCPDRQQLYCALRFLDLNHVRLGPFRRSRTLALNGG